LLYVLSPLWLQIFFMCLFIRVLLKPGGRLVVLLHIIPYPHPEKPPTNDIQYQ
jgi:hypothetical protein